MSEGTLAAAAVTAGALLLGAPYLARLSLSVPVVDDAAWWRWRPVAGRRVIVVAVAGVVLGALAGASARWSALLPAWIALALCCTPLAVIDVEHHRLPNRLMFPAAGLGAALLAVAALSSGDWSRLLRAVEAAAVVYGLFLAICLVATFGYGDVKLGGVLAGYLGWFGWGHVLYGIMAGFVLACLVSLPLLLSKRANMKSAIPLGPSLIVGAFLVAAFDLVPGYLS
ncbi:MAG TPA: A24 family peptidase [Jatrophihabitantaceae bacterium]|jgi:leader peptidase (prepilin peptidase)/N-methyltransferase|nr:A24 family peptidase [Jatrophihabitantaceae bacterium]